MANNNQPSPIEREIERLWKLPDFKGEIEGLWKPPNFKGEIERSWTPNYSK